MFIWEAKYWHLIEYTNQFWRKYKDNRKYSIIISNYCHEGTLNVLKYVDDVIYNFLNIYLIYLRIIY